MDHSRDKGRYAFPPHTLRHPTGLTSQPSRNGNAVNTKHSQVDLFNVPSSQSSSVGGLDRTEIFMAKALEIIRTNEGTYISGKYENAKSQLVVHCKNEHVLRTNYDRLNQGKWCRKCPRPNRVK